MTKKIEWKKVPGFERYSVSELGEVRNDETGYILKPTVRADGRMQVNLFYEPCRRKIVYVHKLVYELFKGDTKGMYIIHADGDKTNNAVRNLYLSRSSNGGKGKARLKRERRVIDVTTGDIYESEMECVLAIGGTPQGVWTCLNGYTKTYKGHVLRYAD